MYNFDLGKIDTIIREENESVFVLGGISMARRTLKTNQTSLFVFGEKRIETTKLHLFHQNQNPMLYITKLIEEIYQSRKYVAMLSM